MIFGTFDVLHAGHRFVVESALREGATTIVVGHDATVRRIKGIVPLQSAEERRQNLADAYPEATVILGDRHDFLAPVRAHAPDLLLLGYDQKLPPGITDADLPCPAKRLPAYQPERYKSSKLRSAR